MEIPQTCLVHYFLISMSIIVEEEGEKGYMFFIYELVKAKHASTARPTWPSCARTTSTITSRSRLGNMPCSVLEGIALSVFLLFLLLCLQIIIVEWETYSTTNLNSLALAFLPSSASTLACRTPAVVEPGNGLVLERGGTGGGGVLFLLL